jgi:hypothetical protein
VIPASAGEEKKGEGHRERRVHRRESKLRGGRATREGRERGIGEE